MLGGLAIALVVCFIFTALLETCKSPEDKAEYARNLEESRQRNKRLWGIDDKSSSDSTPNAASSTTSTNTQELDASSWNGHNWIASDRQTRWDLSQRLANGIQSSAPGISGQFIFDALNEFYDPSVSSTLEVKINEAVGMIAVGYNSEQ